MNLSRLRIKARRARLAATQSLRLIRIHMRFDECVSKPLAIGGWDGTIRIRRVANGEDACPLPGHQAGVERIAFSADGKVLISASSDETVRSWAPDSSKEVRQVKAPRDTSGVVAFSRSGK